jgi:energy-coupling factor transporter transmembrane protein EcfT
MKLSDIQLPPNHKFGLFFTAIFEVIGLYLLTENCLSAAYTFFSLSLIFAIITFAKADLLLPLNKLWMRFGLLLGMIVSPIVLGVIFFGLFTPISMLMKLFGRDELRLKLSDRKSHWKNRLEETSQTNSFKNQF